MGRRREVWRKISFYSRERGLGELRAEGCESRDHEGRKQPPQRHSPPIIKTTTRQLIREFYFTNIQFLLVCQYSLHAETHVGMLRLPCSFTCSFATDVRDVLRHSQSGINVRSTRHDWAA